MDFDYIEFPEKFEKWTEDWDNSIHGVESFAIAQHFRYYPWFALGNKIAAENNWSQFDLKQVIGKLVFMDRTFSTAKRTLISQSSDLAGFIARTANGVDMDFTLGNVPANYEIFRFTNLLNQLNPDTGFKVGQVFKEKMASFYQELLPEAGGEVVLDAAAPFVQLPIKSEVIMLVPPRETEGAAPVFKQMDRSKLVWRWHIPGTWVNSILQEDAASDPLALVKLWCWQNQFRNRLPTREMAWTMKFVETADRELGVRYLTGDATPFFFPLANSADVLDRMAAKVTDLQKLDLARETSELRDTWKSSPLGWEETTNSYWYVNGSHNPTVIELAGSVPVSDASIFALGTMKASDEKMPFSPLEAITDTLQFLTNTSFNAKFQEPWRDYWYQQRCSRTGLPAAWDYERLEKYNAQDFKAWLDNLPIKTRFMEAVQWVWDRRNDPALITAVNDQESLYVVLGFCYILIQLDTRWDEIAEKYKGWCDTQLAHPVRRIKPNSEKGYPVPFIKDLSYQPHQMEALSQILYPADDGAWDSPQNVVSMIDAGGGKTIIILTWLLALMRSKRIRKPLVVCPGHLVKNYVEEIAFMTQGQGRVVPFTTESVSEHGVDVLIERAKEFGTILVTDYNWIVNNSDSVAVFDDWMDISYNLQTLIDLGVDALAADEAHYLKNTGSQRTTYMRPLLDAAKYRMFASGTVILDNLLDLVNQAGMLVPQALGDSSNFAAVNSQTMVHDKVLLWKPGTGQYVMQTLNRNLALLTYTKEKWAQNIPLMRENVHVVHMTENQQSCYEGILKNTLEEIRVNNPKLWNLLMSASEDDENKVMNLLSPYLQKLERFITAPTKEKIGDMLKGEDRVSPTLQKVVKILQDHMDKGIQGDVLILTNSLLSAEYLYESLPEDLKALAIHYTAGRKHECLAKFANHEHRFLIGVEQSLREGLNLQHVSRAILTEMVWSPGHIEQLLARYRRPELKKVDNREGVYLDLILCDGSIGIPKFGRLVSKIVSKVLVEKWYDADYQTLPELPRLSMNLDSITNYASIDSLQAHFEAYTKCRALEEEEFKIARHKLRNVKPLIPVENGSTRKNEWKHPQTWVSGSVPLEVKKLQQKFKLKHAILLDLEVGMKAVCEYGKGTVVRVNKNSAAIEVKGERHTIGFNKLWIRV